MPDFMTVKSEQISHIDLIVMNPPFSADEKHILHAWEIAPPGCRIKALCNLSTIENPYRSARKQLATLIEQFGTFESLGDCFSDAERKTGVEVAFITLLKPGGSYDTEFAGFFMDDSPEEQSNGIISYNFIRDVVNRYVAAVKLYDEQLATGVKMNNLLSGFYKSDLSFSCTQSGQPILRNEFKKDLQKKAWKFILDKMKMQKYTTKGLQEDLNKFVEKQEKVPFTMQNIYQMINLIVGTHSDRMGKALIDIFDKLTRHTHENRYNIEGWKTNSHFLINEKFIMPWLAEVGWSGQMSVRHNGNYEYIDDMQKGLCWLMGEDYDNIGSLWSYMHRYTADTKDSPSYAKVNVKHEFNTWYDFGFFQFKGFKKGTMHFKFKDKEVWGRFNQKIAHLKGYPLYEHKRAA